jgi:hypothetical protein
MVEIEGLCAGIVVWSECDGLAFEADAAEAGVACLAEPLHAGEVLGFEAAAAGAFAADVGDSDGLFGEAGEAEGDAEELAATFEGGAFEVERCGRGWFGRHD